MELPVPETSFEKLGPMGTVPIVQTVQPIHRGKVGHFMSTKICISRVIQNTALEKKH